MSLDFQNIHSLKLLTFLYGQNQHTLIIPRHSLHHSIELTLVIRGHIYTISISFLGNKTHLGSLIDFQEAIYTCFFCLFFFFSINTMIDRVATDSIITNLLAAGW